MSDGKLSRAELLEKLNAIEDLPTLPAIAQKAMEMANDPEVSIKELAKLINADPPLAAKFMRLANSAFYGRANPAKTIEQAITTLGLFEVVIVCSTLGMIQAFDLWKQIQISRDQLWSHSLSTAFLADEMSKKMGAGQSGPDMFLAGLLHNIGWIVLDFIIPVELAGALADVTEDTPWTLTAEHDRIGSDHCEIGGRFLMRWGLPDELWLVVASHHNPEQAGEYLKHVAIIQAAAAISISEFPLEPVDLDDSYVRSTFEIPEEEDDAYAYLAKEYKKSVEKAQAKANALLSV